jgi:hypothetical protein
MVDCMADTNAAAFFCLNAAPSSPSTRKDIAMVEILFMAQLVRNPIEAIARRWYCRSLFRASRGRRGCPEATK